LTCRGAEKTVVLKTNSAVPKKKRHINTKTYTHRTPDIVNLRDAVSFKWNYVLCISQTWRKECGRLRTNDEAMQIVGEDFKQRSRKILKSSSLKTKRHKILQVNPHWWLLKFKGHQMLQEEEYHGYLLSVASLLKHLATKYRVLIAKRYTSPHVILRITVPWHWRSLCPGLWCNDMICVHQYA
jgi:hypothetical protein